MLAGVKLRVMDQHSTQGSGNTIHAHHVSFLCYRNLRVLPVITEADEPFNSSDLLDCNRFYITPQSKIVCNNSALIINS